MSKFFSLLSGKDVRVAPGEKVIPSKEFTTLHKASEILKAVEQEAHDFKLQTASDAEKIKEQAYQEGFQEGLTSLNQHLFALDAELKEIRTDVQEKILPLALKAARKLIGEELKLHPDRIVDVVMTSLKPVTQHKKIVIYVNKNDLEALEKSKSKVKKIFEHLESLSIQERSDIEPGGCIIQTEAGIINAQLENQWQALEAAFATFMKK
ncbi:MAG: HrpE/YscL family type III secretion apparatus protein [Verrucomicrobia bacterium]|nr:HrpE/YscL family type III secretion apparatus protein [Verrucomicrobiota bacterium]